MKIVPVDFMKWRIVCAANQDDCITRCTEETFFVAGTKYKGDRADLRFSREILWIETGDAVEQNPEYFVQQHHRFLHLLSSYQFLAGQEVQG